MFERAKSSGGILRNWQTSKRQSQFKSYTVANFDYRGERKLDRKFIATWQKELLGNVHHTAERKLGWNECR
jgi:hypothetical protein